MPPGALENAESSWPEPLVRSEGDTPPEAPPMPDAARDDAAPNDATTLLTPPQLVASLRDLNSLLRARFGHLIDHLADPRAPDTTDALAALKTTVADFQQTLNRLRPFQAREELILMLRAQLAEKRAMLDELDDASVEASLALADARKAEEDARALRRPDDATLPRTALESGSACVERRPKRDDELYRVLNQVLRAIPLVPGD